jgi:HAD superfamily phosphatase
MMSQPILIFDMDGVLVDVTQSYRETITRTVEHFTGRRLAPAEIQDYKNQGGWNDDWKLSHHIVSTAGCAATFEEVKAHFQTIFHGDGTDGLILRERWVARPGMLEKLNQRFRFALFTGRTKWEAELTLRRFAPELEFAPIVGMDEVERHKPDPQGLRQILDANPGVEAYYVGDTVDDARSARAAGVPFIGIAAPANPAYVDLVFLFQDEGSYAIVDDINYLEEVFAL